MLLTLIACAVTCPPLPQDFQAIVGTFRFDPVQLVRTGKPIVGAYSIWHDHHAYRYLFVNESNRREFLARPSLYEIQLGGGCGKMGSLSGRGSPDRFALHEGRIFVFASESCRSQFLAAPDKYMERDDAEPRGTREQAEQGRALLNRALAWAGGRAAWQRVREFQTEIRETVKSGATSYDHRTTTTIRWPDRILRTDKWNESSYSDLYDGRRGYFLNANSTTPMDPQQVRALQRIRNRMLPTVLIALAKGTPRAYDRGPAADGVRRVEVYFDRTCVALDINANSGEIRAMEFSGRRQMHGSDRLVFDSFAEIKGLKFPNAWTTYFDGNEDGRRTPDQVFIRLDSNGVHFDLPKRTTT